MESEDFDLVVLDLALGDREGLEVLKRIKSGKGDCPVLVLSMFDEKVYAERCLRAGASGYVMKEDGAELLLEAIRTILRGEVFVSQVVKERMVRGLARSGGSAGRTVRDLSDRELQVFRLLGEGLSTREVAERLSLSVKTIESHRARIKEKLGIESASQLVHRAVSWVRGEMGMD